MNDIKVIVCHIAELPAWHTIQYDPEQDGHLDGMQAIVGGNIELVHLADPAVPGLELWCNEDGMHLPINRVFRATPRRVPPGFENAFVIDMTDGEGARPGEPGEWRIRGDFFLARSDADGNLAPCTDADMAWAQRTFLGEDPEIAAAWFEAKSRLIAAAWFEAKSRLIAAGLMR